EYYTKKAKVYRDKINSLYNQYLEVHGLKRIFLLSNTAETFDLDSATQKLAALRRMGLELKDVKRETLQKLDTEITNLLGEYSKCTKIITTYGEGMLNKRSKTTGRLHPEFNQLGSGDLERKKGGKTTTIDTGRWSSDAQQFPRPEHIKVSFVESEIEEIKDLFGSKYADEVKSLQEAK